MCMLLVFLFLFCGLFSFIRIGGDYELSGIGGFPLLSSQFLLATKWV